MIKSHARERLPGESFEDYKARRAWSNRTLALLAAPRPTESHSKSRLRRFRRDMGQNPKFQAERKRKPTRGHPPTWPSTDDQRKQSRPVIVLHPVKQLRKMGMGGALRDMGNRLLNAPKWALDEMASDVRSSLKAALQDALRGQR